MSWDRLGEGVVIPAHPLTLRAVRPLPPSSLTLAAGVSIPPKTSPRTRQNRSAGSAARARATACAYASYRSGCDRSVVQGYEIAGVVDAIGKGVAGFEVGIRVAALTVYGGFADLIVRGAEQFLPIPDGVTDRDAAAVKARQQNNHGNR